MALESVGRVAYALGLLLGDLYRRGEHTVVVPTSLLIVTAGVQVGAHCWDFYGKCAAKGEESYWKEISVIVGTAGFVASGLWAVPLARHSEHTFSVALAYFLYLTLSLANSVPPVHLNNRGFGSIVLVLTNGIMSVQLITLALNLGWSLQGVLLCAPSHLMLQASVLITELSTAGKDFDILSTATLLSRHDSFRFAVILHCVAYFVVVLDALTLSCWRGLPLLLAPWSLSQLSALQQSHLSGVSASSRRLFVAFTVLSEVSLFLEFAAVAHTR